jgi:GT2 family glycosyltransferase
MLGFPPAGRRRVTRDVTVIMKTFQRPRTAKLAVQQLRRRYPAVRLLVADDSRIPLELDDPGVRLLRLPFDSGISRGRNLMLSQVETEYFLLMDDDHFFNRRTKLERMLRILERERFDILACHVHFRRLTERWFQKRELFDFFMNLRLEDGTLHHLADYHEVGRDYRVCDLVENFFLARTQSVRAMGGWDDRFKILEHVDFFLRAQRQGLKVGYTPRCAVDHVHIRKERISPDYAPFRIDRRPEFRRLLIETHGIRRMIYRDGTSRSGEDLLRE